jgi:hypothetical protein
MWFNVFINFLSYFLGGDFCLSSEFFTGLAGALVFLLLVLTALVVVFGATVFCDFFALAVGVVDFTTVFFLAAVFDEFGFPVWALTVEDFVFVVVLLVLGMRVSVILI